MKRFMVLSGALLLVVPACALARPFGPAEEASYTEAVDFWGRAPSLCAHVDKAVVDLPPGEDGTASIPPFQGYFCTLRIDTEAAAEPGRLCRVMTHEVGHLLGLSHSADPTSVMAEATPWASVPHCAAKRLSPDTSRLERQQAWAEWREHRAECRESRGPYRKKCWRAVRAERKRLARR